MASKSTEKRRSQRTHSLGGCATCRRRHVKCDQVRPSCLTCRAIGVTCEGFPAAIRWVSGPSATSMKKSESDRLNAKSARRHLYTEDSRASMSMSLTADLGSNSLDASLAEIDARSKDNNEPTAGNIAVGPFGVLSFNLATPGDQAQTGHVNELDSVDDLRTETPSTLNSGINFDDSLQWADLFELDFDNMNFPQHENFGSVTWNLAHDEYAHNDRHGWAQTGDLSQAINLPQIDRQNDILQPPQLTSLLSPVAMPAVALDALKDAQLLLRHFRDTVIPQMAALPTGSKSPWKILNLSAAVRTLADITFLAEQKLKHASIANLYGLLACSAYHLASNHMNHSLQSVKYWEEIVLQTSDHAKAHLKLSLQTELQGPDKAKYKDQLMAILNLMAFAIISGQHKDARCYMLDAEHLLRLRGLAKREISRKARLLHHVYTWARIVGESTYVIHDYKSYMPVLDTLCIQELQQNPGGDAPFGRRTDFSKRYTGYSARLDDFLRIEAHRSDSDLEVDEPKEREIGLHDIHLEDSRNFPDTMYIEIYGIPETWLSLLSQTTRLANAINALNASEKPPNSAPLDALNRRAARLEDRICSAASSNSSEIAFDTPTPNIHMLRALNSALVIFFYRRIRDVNPWILQSHVDDVIHALHEFDSALIQYSVEGPGTPWPAFIAGCEAIALSQRDSLLRWIEKGIATCGLYGFQGAKEMMMQVWKRRDDHPRSGSGTRTHGFGNRNSLKLSSWVEISREQNLWLMLC